MAVKICPKCNRELEEDAQFCKYCGYSLDETEDTYDKVNPRIPRLFPIRLVMLVLLLVLCGLFGRRFLHGGGTSAPEVQPSEELAVNETGLVRLVSYGKHMYGFYDISALEAQDLGALDTFCRDMGGKPAVIGSAKENRRLYNQILSLGKTSAIFGGGSKNYTNWSLDVKDDGSGFAIFNGSRMDGTWNNADPTQGEILICEWNTINSGVEAAVMSNILPEQVTEIDGHTYALYDMSAYDMEALIGRGRKAFGSIRNFCKVRGGHLATIESEAENRALYQMVSEAQVRTAFFSFSDQNKEGEWIWADKSSDYVNWAEGLPDGGEEQNYAQFFVAAGDGTWNDAQLGQESTWFICEWEK